MAHLVADVITRVAPEIPGLPTGAELAGLVASYALAVYASSLVDPDLRPLGERDRRTALAGRVGMALAFPELEDHISSRAAVAPALWATSPAG